MQGYYRLTYDRFEDQKVELSITSSRRALSMGRCGIVETDMFLVAYFQYYHQYFSLIISFLILYQSWVILTLLFACRSHRRRKQWLRSGVCAGLTWSARSSCLQVWYSLCHSNCISCIIFSSILFLKLSVYGLHQRHYIKAHSHTYIGTAMHQSCRYWPISVGEEESTGPFIINNEDVKSENGFIITKLILSNMEEHMQPPLEITHFQFVAWKGG